MDHMKKSSVWLLPILALLVLILMFLFAMNENEAWKGMKNIWDSGVSVEGNVQKLGDLKQRFSIQFDYSVDGKEYSKRTSLSEEDFARIDGEDQDGKGTAEVRYDPNKPQNAVLEGSMDYQVTVVESRLKTAKILLVVFITSLVYAGLTELGNRKRRRF